MNFAVINAFLYFYINGTLAQEKKCNELHFKPIDNTAQAQSRTDEEIIKQLNWKSTVHNLLRLTTSGSSLKAGPRSDNLCKCVLSLIGNREDRYRYSYDDYSNVVGESAKIDIRLKKRVFEGIPIIKCHDSKSKIRYALRIMKGNKGRFFSWNIYDIYALVEAQGDGFDYVCTGKISGVNMDIFKLPVPKEP